MTAPIVSVNKDNFKAEVLDAQTLVLIDFYADWCGPCRAMAPALDSFAKANAGKVKVVKINVDDNQELAAAFGIRALPTLVTMKDGRAIYGATGLMSASQIEELAEKSLQDPPAPHINGGGARPGGKGPRP